MPREHRKRGKKHKKNAEETQEHNVDEQRYDDEQEAQAGPSWIVQSDSGLEDVNPEAPFGYVDPDVKAYFRTVDEKLKEWQELRDYARSDEVGSTDPIEERRLFVVAALTELSGKERQLATDPDCSTVLERMIHSMDDFVKRVFLDRLAGSFQVLARHRFASHVLQTLLTVAKDAVHRETKGIIAPAPESSSDEGTLPPLTQLLIGLCEELLPETSSLLMDPFASHVLRALFVLICPELADSLPSSEAEQTLRSKKSAKYKAKQGPMKSVFESRNSRNNSTGEKRAVSTELSAMTGRFVKIVRDALSENEVRALAANKVACPVLALLLEMERVVGESNIRNSLMDSVSCGVVSACLEDPRANLEPSDFVATLLRDPASSHLLEALVASAPSETFNAIWTLYFKGKLNKLAVHPVANFVVARAIGRLDASQLTDTIAELEGIWSKVIRNARTGVLRAILDRSASFTDVAKSVCEAIAAAFGIETAEDRTHLVPCVLHLKSLDEYKGHLAHNDNSINDGSAAHLEPATQGSLLLQSTLKLPDPCNDLVLTSLLSLPIDQILSMSRSPISSRVLDAFLESPTVPSRSKRKFLISMIGHYQELVDDRIGSRVGDRCWATADPYLKEKIAGSLFAHEQTLAASFFGRFFAKNLNLYLLKKDPEAWKSMQASKSAKDVSQKVDVVKTESSQPTNATTVNTVATKESKEKKRKRESKPDDEIDKVFASTLGKKAKVSSLPQTSAPAPEKATEPQHGSPDKRKDKSRSKTGDSDLNAIFGAIRSAPKELKSGGRKK